MPAFSSTDNFTEDRALGLERLLSPFRVDIA